MHERQHLHQQRKSESPRVRSLRKFLLVALGIASAICIVRGAIADTPSPASAPSPTQLADPVWIAEGKAKFIHTCSYCHGEAGDAGKNEPFRTHTGWDPQEIHDTIAEGRHNGANVMPSWKDSIPDEEIWKIVAYIHSLEGKPRQ